MKKVNFVLYLILITFFYISVILTRLNALDSYNIIIMVAATFIWVLGVSLKVVRNVFNETQLQKYERLLSVLDGLEMGFLMIFAITLGIRTFSIH